MGYKIRAHNLTEPIEPQLSFMSQIWFTCHDYRNFYGPWSLGQVDTFLFTPWFSVNYLKKSLWVLKTAWDFSLCRGLVLFWIVIVFSARSFFKRCANPGLFFVYSRFFLQDSNSDCLSRRQGCLLLVTTRPSRRPTCEHFILALAFKARAQTRSSSTFNVVCLSRFTLSCRSTTDFWWWQIHHSSFLTAFCSKLQKLLLEHWWSDQCAWVA